MVASVKTTRMVASVKSLNTATEGSDAAQKVGRLPFLSSGPEPVRSSPFGIYIIPASMP